MDENGAETIIDTYVASLTQVSQYEQREEAILDSVLTMAHNDSGDTQGSSSSTSDDEIDSLLKELSDDTGEPDDYWDFLMGKENSAG